MIFTLLTVLLSLFASTSTAVAHQINLTNARVVVMPDRVVKTEIALKGSDADRVAGTSVFDEKSGTVRPTTLAASAAPILAYVTSHSAILGADDAACQPGAGHVSADGDGVVVQLSWSCTGVADPLRYRSTVLTDVSADARQVVLIGDGPNPAQDLLDASRTETALTEAAPPTLWHVIASYAKAGIEHIFLGYDHIAFLAAVMLWARRLWPVVKVVTAFTLAHSITLSLAALDIVRIPSEITEPAIAASIVYVAAENFFSRDVGNRWRITFGFGLIHGFGFASALQEFGLPRSALVPALASFNLGVEIGQIAIVSIVLPLLIGIDRLLASRPGVPIAPRSRAVAVYSISAVIICLGSYWFLARTVFTA